MNKILSGIFAGPVLGSAVTWTVVRRQQAEDEKEKTKEHNASSRVIHTNGQSFVKLDKESQQHAGMKVAELEAAMLKPEIRSYGHVLDPAPLAALVAEIATARAALEASKKEFQRWKLLHSQGQNVSARALEAAEASMKRDQIATDTAHWRLVSGWGKAVVNRPDLPEFVRSLSAVETALVRIDLPLGQVLAQPPVGGRIAALATPEQPAEAQLVGPVPVADPQTQGQGFLFLLRTRPLPPGTAVIGWLALAGETASGVLVPRSALLRHQGQTLVYLQVNDDVFQRKEVELEHPTESGWFVGEGLKPQQKIVVTGAQQLLSEELKEYGGEPP